MTRIPPSCLRYTSGALGSPFVGTSSYYFERQNKQNIALHAAIKPLNRVLKMRALRCRKTEPFVLQPGLHPVYTQLKALSYVKHMLHMSHSWFKNKTLSCASHMYLGIFRNPKKHQAQLQNKLACTAAIECPRPRAIDALVHMNQKRAKKAPMLTRRISQKLPYYCMHTKKRPQKPFYYRKIRNAQCNYIKNQTSFYCSVTPSNLHGAAKEKQTLNGVHSDVYYYGLQYTMAKYSVALRRGYWASLQSFTSAMGKPQNKQHHKKAHVSNIGLRRTPKAPCVFMLLCMHMIKHKIYDIPSGSYVPGLKLGMHQSGSKKRKQFFDFQTLKHVPQDYRVNCTAGQHFPKAACKSKRQRRRGGAPVDVGAYNLCDIYNARPKVALSRSFNKPLGLALFLYINGLLTYAKTQSIHRGIKCKVQHGNVTKPQGFKALSSLTGHGYDSRACSMHLSNKDGISRLKTCLVFDLKLMGQNQDVKSLRPTLSIRL